MIFLISRNPFYWHSGIIHVHVAYTWFKRNIIHLGRILYKRSKQCLLGYCWSEVKVCDFLYTGNYNLIERAAFIYIYVSILFADQVTRTYETMHKKNNGEFLQWTNHKGNINSYMEPTKGYRIYRVDICVWIIYNCMCFHLFLTLLSVMLILLSSLLVLVFQYFVSIIILGFRFSVTPPSQKSLCLMVDASNCLGPPESEHEN